MSAAAHLLPTGLSMLQGAVCGRLRRQRQPHLRQGRQCVLARLGWYLAVGLQGRLEGPSLLHVLPMFLPAIIYLCACSACSQLLDASCPAGDHLHIHLHSLQVNGQTCHQCRQKTLGKRTCCSGCESLTVRAGL